MRSNLSEPLDLGRTGKRNGNCQFAAIKSAMVQSDGCMKCFLSENCRIFGYVGGI